MLEKPPQFDQCGLNILDPADKLGHKSKYITLLQELVLTQELPLNGGSGRALDLGCGWGRLTEIVRSKGWDTYGIDPDSNLISYARRINPKIEYNIGALPDLPVEEQSFDLILLQNVLRPLLLSNNVEAAKAISKYLRTNGQLFVVENVKNQSPEHFKSEEVESFFQNEGLKTVSCIAFRASRNPMLLPIKYGLIPESLFESLARLEVKFLKRVNSDPKFQYYNKLFIFRKNQ